MSIQQNFDVKNTSTGPGSDRDRSQDVAIVGIGCLFPESPGLKAYLQLLLQGRDAISDPPDSHAHLNQYLDPDPRKADHIYCNRGGFLPPVCFDPTAFGIPPNVIEATDTSQLLSLIVATDALEDAGYGPDGKAFHRRRTSVILGVTGTQELVIPLSSRLGHPIWKKALAESGITGAKADEVVEKIASAYVQWQENSFPGLLGNVVAGRICNRLDLGGTNCVVDAACASSMGAIHLALLELCAGRSDMVIAGGADTINDIFMHMCFSRTMILSKSGHARPFSARADGTVLGEGIGLLVLKRLEDALRDNDRVYAVIKGLGSASDGRSNGIYAPRAEGQIEALERAYDQAGIDPASVEMVEAHGTGTRVGDQVEFEALCRVFGRDAENRRCKCALGSVKSNIGHTKAAAGTAGLIKAALALHHKVVFPTLKAEQVDPKLKVEQSPFYINSRLRPWIGADGHPRRAGVSAFGFGGSNFHAVLEEFDPSKKEVSWDGRVQILAFSHDDFSALLAEVEKFRDKVLEPAAEKQDIELAAASLRAAFNPGHDHRLVLVADFQEPVTKLAGDLSLTLRQLQESGGSGSGLRKGYFYGRGRFRGKVAFLFPGQGSQYPYMGRDLACVFPEFLDILREANRLFHDRRSLSSYIYPEEGQGQNADRQLRSTRIAQPAIGAVSAGMAAVLERFGLRPDLVCGHSFGELTALYAAGWITRADFLRLGVLRGQLMHRAAAGRTSPGGMLAVRAEAEACRRIVESLAGDLVVANFNSPVQTVLSGSLEAVDKAHRFFRQKGISAVKLPVAAAFHSPLVTEAARPFAEAVAGTRIEPTSVRVISNTTAVPYPLEREQAQELLGHQLSHPVRFLDSIVSLYRQHEARIFVEVGPRRILTGLVNEILEDSKVITAAIDDSAGRSWQLFDLAHTLAMAASLGLPVDLGRWESPPRPRPKARLEIRLCGANYRSKQTAPSAGGGKRVPKTDTNSQKMISAENTVRKNNEHKQEHKVMNNQPLPEPAFEATTAQKRHGSEQGPQTGSAGDSSLMLQGIQALQNLHQQTALAHQKFLETQAEAARTLQRILEADPKGVSAPAAEVQEPETAATLPPRPVPEIEPSSCQVPSRPEPEAQKAEFVEDEPQAAAETASPPPAAAGNTDPASGPASSGQAGENVARVLVETVARLTGYPEQMLEMDMDIEADLGIDSIKRVEILSAMEEALPGLARITPDQMGKLKTLGQIRDFLLQGSSGKEVAPSAKTASAGSAVKQEASGVAADDIARVLVETVARLTGYPEQMLEMDMDIEADLGIDSIKRVEILSAMEEALPGLARITPDQMGKLKTLGQIRDFLASGQPRAACKNEESRIPAKSCRRQPPDMPAGLPRQIVRPVPWPEDGNSKAGFSQDAPVIICGRNDNLVKSLKAALAGENASVRVFAPETVSCQDIDRAAGLILTAPLEPAEAFALARHCAPLLRASAGKGGAFFATVTCIDGAFGLSGGEINQPEQGALAGLLKTAAREWPGVRCLAMDLDPCWQETDAMAEAVVEQLLCCPGPSGVEIGLGPGGRTRLEMVPADFPEGLPDLGPEDVVVITGGGRGVTARAAAVLAAACRPKIALLGRSAEPFDEPGWLQGITGQAEMKKALLEFEFKGGKPSPRQLETAYRRYLANREIKASLKAVADAGSQVRYFRADVRNQQEVDRVVDEVRRTMGRITALIHGAGVLADKAIAEKSDRQFELVYSTKVDGWRCLLKACADAPLRYVVVFSSVTARTGNPGQADYAMANEALNKLAAAWARKHPACKVTAINWGPWDGGMVDRHLKRNFQRRGVALIRPEEGAGAMLAEMAPPPEDPVEVVIGSALELPQKPETDKPGEETGAEAEMDLAFQHEVSLESHPVLDHHRLDGRPVVPMALLAEWLGHVALHSNPGLRLVGLDRVRLLKGIVLEEKTRKVSLLTGKTRASVAGYTVPVEIRDGFENGSPVIHCRAEAILAESIPEPPVFDQQDLLKPGAENIEVEQAYDRMLFHGSSFQGIEAILRIDAKGLAARLATAPPPRKWLKEPLRSNWIADPLVLDCAFQMAIIWSRTVCGKPSLPGYIRSYRQYVERFPASGVIAVMQVTASGANRLASDFIFLDPENRVMARLQGYEAVMDENLERAFNAN